MMGRRSRAPAAMERRVRVTKGVEIGRAVVVMRSRIGSGRSTMQRADAAHATSAVWAPSEGQVIRLGCLRVGGLRRTVGGIVGECGPCQGAHAFEILSAFALGEKAVMTDAMEAGGQDVQQVPPDELVRGKAHDAGASAAAMVPVGERDFVVANVHEPRIGDGGSMRVAGEIDQYALGPPNGGLA